MASKKCNHSSDKNHIDHVIITCILLITVSCTTPSTSTKEDYTDTSLPTYTASPSITPTDIPIPDWAETLPEKYSLVINDDGSFGIGREIKGEIVLIPGFSYIAGKLYIEGEEKNIIIDNAIIVGEDGNPAILGEFIENPTEVDAQKISIYFDGEKWVTPAEERNMRYTPELMVIKEEKIPAKIDVVYITPDKSEELKSSDLKGINIVGENNFSEGYMKYQIIETYPFTLSQVYQERITVFPGVIGRQESFNQVYLSFLYKAGSTREVTLLVKSPINHPEKASMLELTDDYIGEYFLPGNKYSLTLSVPSDTTVQPINIEGLLAKVHNNLYPSSAGNYEAYYRSWNVWNKLYSQYEIRRLLTTSTDLLLRDSVVVSRVAKFGR